MNQSKKGVFSVFKQDSSARQTPFYCRWTEEEDKLLFEAVEFHGPHKWSLIARHIPGRTPVQCSTRWLGALNPHVHKGRWSKEEDKILTAEVAPLLVDSSLTEDNLPWSRIAKNIPNRTGIQCQARWTEALDPSVRKGRWKKEEDDMLKVGVERYGCCWIRVAGSLPGRTQRQCRTRWNQIQSKRQKTKPDSYFATIATDNTDKTSNVIKKQPRKKKRVEDSSVKWKSSQQDDNFLSTTPIQLEVPTKTPYILLSKQPSNAIIIPSEILSPLSSPTMSASSPMEEEDYFCTSPTSTCSSDTFISANKQDTAIPFSNFDTASILDNIGSFESLLKSANNSYESYNQSTLSSLLSCDFLTQFDPDLPSLMLLDVPSVFNQDQQEPQQGKEDSMSLETLLLGSGLFLDCPSTAC